MSWSPGIMPSLQETDKHAASASEATEDQQEKIYATSEVEVFYGMDGDEDEDEDAVVGSTRTFTLGDVQKYQMLVKKYEALRRSKGRYDEAIRRARMLENPFPDAKKPTLYLIVSLLLTFCVWIPYHTVPYTKGDINAPEMDAVFGFSFNLAASFSIGCTTSCLLVALSSFVSKKKEVVYRLDLVRVLISLSVFCHIVAVLVEINTGHLTVELTYTLKAQRFLVCIAAFAHLLSCHVPVSSRFLFLVFGSAVAMKFVEIYYNIKWSPTDLPSKIRMYAVITYWSKLPFAVLLVTLWLSILRLYRNGKLSSKVEQGQLSINVRFVLIVFALTCVVEATHSIIDMRNSFPYKLTWWDLTSFNTVVGLLLKTLVVVIHYLSPTQIAAATMKKTTMSMLELSELITQMEREGVE
jgi:hypothetical protein